MWNDVGVIRCFSSEDGLESSIEVEFHDVAIHRSMHINNYRKHFIAALSAQALALSCKTSDNNAGKIVVIVLQGRLISYLFNKRDNAKLYFIK